MMPWKELEWKHFSLQLCGKWGCRPGQQSPRGSNMNIVDQEMVFCDQKVLNYLDKGKEIQ